MKALVLTDNQKMSVKEIELPALSAGEARIKIASAGLCSSDIFRSCDKGAYNYPLVMGHEIAGVVEEISPDIKNFRKGDRVVVFPLIPCFKCKQCDKKEYAQCASYDYYGSRRDGGFAEYLNVKEWNLLKLPNEVDFRDAALIEPMSVMVHAIRKTDLLNRKIKNVALIGAGFLGIILAKILKAKRPDINLTVLDRNEYKLDLVKDFSHEQVKLSGEKEWSDYLAKNNNFEFVIEATGVPKFFANSIALAAHGGEILWLGNITDDLNLPKKTVSSILRKELKVLGVWNSSYKNSDNDDWQETINLMKSGIRPSELVTKWATLEEIPEILLNLYDHKIGKGKYEQIKVAVYSSHSKS